MNTAAIIIVWVIVALSPQPVPTLPDVRGMAEDQRTDALRVWRDKQVPRRPFASFDACEKARKAWTAKQVKPPKTICQKQVDEVKNT